MAAILDFWRGQMMDKFFGAKIFNNIIIYLTII